MPLPPDASVSSRRAYIAATDSFEALGDLLVSMLRQRLAFDRFNIGLLDMTAYAFTDAYVFGRNVKGRAVGHKRTLEGTVVAAGIAAWSRHPCRWRSRSPCSDDFPVSGRCWTAACAPCSRLRSIMAEFPYLPWCWLPRHLTPLMTGLWTVSIDWARWRSCGSSSSRRRDRLCSCRRRCSGPQLRARRS